MIVIRLADGRERAISRSATAPAAASDDLAVTASRDVHISVRTLLPLANHVRVVLASRHAALEGGGERDLDQTVAKQDTDGGITATSVAAASRRDAAPTGTAGGPTRATSAIAIRPIRGGSACWPRRR